MTPMTKPSVPVLAMALGLAVPAAASCPTPGDLTSGINLTYSDGTVETYRSLDGARVEMMLDDGDVQRDELAHGLYLLRSVDVVGTREEDPLTVDYGMAPAALPKPASGQKVTLDVQETYAGETNPVREVYAAGASRRFDVGGCALNAFDVKLRRQEAGFPDALEVVRYFPELGFGYVYGIGDEGQPLDTYDLVAIEARK